MTVALLTAIYDNYDPLHEICGQSVPYDAYCVTDNPRLESDSWQIIVEPRDCHPNLAAKSPKMCPWRYTDADVTVWIDGAFQVTGSTFLEDMSAYTFAQFGHPWRDCIYAELEASRYHKYDGLPLDAQVDSYRQAGHPPNWGLWATGLIVRHRNPWVEQFGKAWLTECERWSFQDQLSEAPMLRIHDLRPDTLPGSYRRGSNPWVAYVGSVRH